MKRAALTLAVLGLCAGPALADEIKCEGAFGKDATLSDFEKAYGKANVVTGEVPGPEGTTMIATTVFPGDEDKTFQVYWWDEEKHEGLAGVTIAKADTAPMGIKLGMPIEEVQKINGQVFTLMGFGWDYGGAAGFQEGNLANLPGGCFMSLTFAPSVDELPEATSEAISGDKEIRSDMKEFSIAKPVVTAINLGYPAPEGFGEDEGEGGDAE
jgi:hypothetical protein